MIIIADMLCKLWLSASVAFGFAHKLRAAGWYVCRKQRKIPPDRGESLRDSVDSAHDASHSYSTSESAFSDHDHDSDASNKTVASDAASITSGHANVSTIPPAITGSTPTLTAVKLPLTPG